MTLAADPGEIRRFVGALLRYADSQSFVSLRAFDQVDRGKPPLLIEGVLLGDDREDLVERATRAATKAALAPAPAVFAPPVCTFTTGRSARSADVANGVALSVEIDTGDAEKGRRQLEQLLGPATVVVASGGEWQDPETGELHPKLHLHWRLSEPTATPEDHDALREARWRASALVGGDPTAAPLAHPLRWPGSWNRKREPRMARIVALHESAEIELSDAQEVLAEALEATGLGRKTGGTPKASAPPQAPLADVAAALLAIPNADLHWDDWNRIGMAAWRATGGSAEGLAAWEAWSAKSPKHAAEGCLARWKHFAASPPNSLGAGTIFHLARVHGWRGRQRQQPERAARRADDTATRRPEPEDEAAPPEEGDAETPGEAPARGRRGRRDQVAQIFSHLDADWVLGHDAKHYAVCRLGRDRREVMPVDGKAFELLLHSLALELHGNTLSDTMLRSAVTRAVLRARDSRDVRRICRRVARHEDGIFVDLGGADPFGERAAAFCSPRSAFEIVDPSDVPVLFVRAPDALPLPRPERDAARWGDFGEFVNADSDENLILVPGVLTTWLRPFTGKGSYPVISLTGEAGSGKSSATYYLHQLIDPSTVTLLNLSDDPRDYQAVIPARHVSSFDNLSGISDVLSDLFARTSTGSTWAARRLNTDAELHAVRMLAPLLLNGIAHPLGRPDLQERMVVIHLSRLTTRRTDAEMEAAFEQRRAGLLGLLLDGVSSALRNLHRTPVPDGLRMADAAQWAEAASEGLGIEAGSITAAWRANRTAMQRAAIEVDDLARAVVALMAKQERDTGTPEWKGEPTALYQALCELAGERVTKTRQWPSRAAGMANAFRRIAGGLRDVHGIEILSGKGGRDSTRWWSVRRT